VNPRLSHGKRRLIFCTIPLVLMACRSLDAGAADSLRLTEAPVTVTLAVPARGADAPLLLRIEDLVATGGQPVLLRFFAELPSATRDTPVEHPRFMGYITVVPRTSSRTPTSGRNFNLQLPPAVAALAAGRSTLRVTLVLASPTAASGAVTIGRIAIVPAS
jgi:hypothetical protein